MAKTGDKRRYWYHQRVFWDVGKEGQRGTICAVPPRYQEHEEGIGYWRFSEMMFFINMGDITRI